MTRRKFGREFKTEAVRLVTERGVAVAQACRDLDVAESVFRRWMRELTAAPAAAFPGNGQMRADLAEIAALKKEVARLRAERDILKKGEPCAPLVQAQWRALFSRERRYEVRLHRKAPSHLAGQLALRGAGGFALGLPCLAQPPGQRPRDP
jgi:transposase